LSGPNDYMVDKRDAVRAQKKRTQEAGYPPDRYQARVTADDRSGARKVRIRDFQFVSDSGPASGGFDFGPTPVELFFVARIVPCQHIPQSGGDTKRSDRHR
jgi:hypothetical protein